MLNAIMLMVAEVDAMIDYIKNLINALFDQFIRVIEYPITSAQRVFWLYLLTSILVAWLVYRRNAKTPAVQPRETGSFLSFLFPRKVWGHPSAWLDVRYFFFHQVLGKLPYAVLLALTVNIVFQWTTGGPNLYTATRDIPSPGWTSLFISFGYMIVVLTVTDFVAFYTHYLQHKVPILWEFHKVHHSPGVMHPLSNYREHPIDNFGYALGIGATFGLFMGLAYNTFDYLPTMPEILGVPLLMFLFNITGYNLRHTHIWLRWPGRLSMIFPSPAHHHVHHSRHPDHLDKNFAFMFPVWDVLFRTYHMPETNKDVEFGLYGQEGESEYSSCWRLYYLPFRNIFRKLRKNPEHDADPVRVNVRSD